MAKLVTNDVTGGFAGVTAINDNNTLIETAMENTLSLDGTTPNSMSADLDLDSNNLINANSVQVNGQSLVPSSVVAIDTAASVPNVAAGGIAATDVQAALNELDGDKANVIATPVVGDLIVQASGGEMSPAGYALTNVNADVTASDEELNYSVGVTSAIQTQLDAKEPTFSYRGCLVYLDSNQSLSTGTPANIAFDQEDYDTDTIHDNATNNTRLTVPSGVTKVRISYNVQFASNSTGYRNIVVYRSSTDAFIGNTTVSVEAVTGDVTIINAQTPVLTVSSGVYFEIAGLQDSGGALNVIGNIIGSATWFSMEIIE